jgi:hypothetical protein
MAAQNVSSRVLFFFKGPVDGDTPANEARTFKLPSTRIGRKQQSREAYLTE